MNTKQKTNISRDIFYFALDFILYIGSTGRICTPNADPSDDPANTISITSAFADGANHTGATTKTTVEHHRRECDAIKYSIECIGDR